MYNTKMDTIFMISKNSKTDKRHVRRKDNILLYQILAFPIHEKI